MAKSGVIGILCALPDPELHALLDVFKIHNINKPNRQIHSDRYWTTELANIDGEQLKIVISCIAASGNVEVALSTERMISAYNPEVMCLVGIACGLPKLSLGDVVTSKFVLGYEYQKTSPSGNLDRSQIRPIIDRLAKDISMFNNEADWYEIYQKALSKLDKSKLPRSIPDHPKLHKNIGIASGEKVIGAGELNEMHKKYDLLQACEMEGWGFSRACETFEPRKPWLVVRGISDYGDESKDGMVEGGPKKDEYHPLASYSAATFLKTFLIYAYTTSSKYARCKSEELNDTPLVVIMSENAEMGEYDAFLASPMAAYECNERYQEDRKGAMDLIPALKTYCGVKNVFYAGNILPSTDDFEPENVSAIKNFNILKQCKYLVMLYPEKIASSVLVEIGYAIANNIPSVIFVKSRGDLPFLLREISEVSQNVRCFESPDIPSIIKLLEEYGLDVFGRRNTVLD
jgi:nucleoside phosphorylase